MLTLALGLLLAAAVAARPAGSPDRLPAILWLGLGLSAVIALLAYAAWLVLSRGASVVFTPSYREVVDRTLQTDPRTALDSRHRTLRLTLRSPESRPARVEFRFATPGECEHWAGRLAALVGRPTDATAPGGEVAPAEPNPVVLLRQRPAARYQLLRTVEAKSDKRRTAEASLRVRAAVMGADAVVDLQEEFLPDFPRTVRRMTGTAVRAVDA